MEHETLNIPYFRGEKLFNCKKCDLVTMNNGIGSVYFVDLPNSEYLKDIIGMSGTLAVESVQGSKLTWKYCREISFYPFTQCYWEKGEIVTKIDYRLVLSNKIDNVVVMLDDMKTTLENYRKEFRNVNVTGTLISWVDDLLDRIDQDETKMKDFGNQHLTTRKRLAKDYSIIYSDVQSKLGSSKGGVSNEN